MTTLWERAESMEAHAAISAAVAKRFSADGDDGACGWATNMWAADWDGNRLYLEHLTEAADAGDIACMCLGAAIRLECAKYFGVHIADTGGLANEVCRSYCAVGGIAPEWDEGMPVGVGRPYLNAIIEWNDAAGRPVSQIADLVQRTAADCEARAGQ